jgi:hypothetical protein
MRYIKRMTETDLFFKFFQAFAILENLNLLTRYYNVIQEYELTEINFIILNPTNGNRSVRFGRKSNDDSCQTFPSFLLSSSAVVMVE